MNHNFCIILAGGIGQRLWPTSRREMPKQFLDFFGTGRTLLQQTFDRFARIIPLEHILISTFVDYVNTVKEQLPDLPEENILAEPVQLSTAPAAAWAACHIAGLDADANVVATPVDHLIMGEDRFIEQIRLGLEFVATHSQFLAIGVKPTAPNTAYGYIQMGQEKDAKHFFSVQSFSEKPEMNYAKMFLASGEFLWNTGIFLWRGSTMGTRLSQAAGRQDLPVETVARQMVTIAEEMAYVRACFTDNVPHQLDLFILETCKNVAVEVCDFGWADIGCWPELHDVMQHDVDGNALSGKARVLFSGSQNCTVRLPEGMKAVVAGLDGYLVTLEGNALLICPNDRPDAVRRLITEAQVNL